MIYSCIAIEFTKNYISKVYEKGFVATTQSYQALYRSIPLGDYAVGVAGATKRWIRKLWQRRKH
jgi:hypothetical protein